MGDFSYILGNLKNKILLKIYENFAKKRMSIEKSSFVSVNIIRIDGPNLALSYGENRRSTSCSNQKLFPIKKSGA